MIALDEDALICDFAETYHIYNIYALSGDYAAVLAVGLREDSRIKMILNGLHLDVKTLLLAHLVDNTAINVWMKSEDAQKGKNRPKSIVDILLHRDMNETKGFDTGDDFMSAWRDINGN